MHAHQRIHFKTEGSEFPQVLHNGVHPERRNFRKRTRNQYTGESIVFNNSISIHIRFRIYVFVIQMRFSRIRACLYVRKRDIYTTMRFGCREPPAR